MISAVLFLIYHNFVMSSASEVVHKNFLLGSEGQLICPSSFSPPWTKTGVTPNDYHIIGLNGNRHPNWKETRYSFFAEDQNYFLKISNVQLSDAGKFVCGSDSPITFMVTVMR